MQSVDGPVKAIVGKFAISVLMRFGRKQQKSLQEGMTSMNKEIIDSLIAIVVLVNDLRKGRVSKQTSQFVAQKRGKNVAKHIFDINLNKNRLQSQNIASLSVIAYSSTKTSSSQ